MQQKIYHLQTKVNIMQRNFKYQTWRVRESINSDSQVYDSFPVHKRSVSDESRILLNLRTEADMQRRDFNKLQNALLDKHERLQEAQQLIKELKNQQDKKPNELKINNLIKTAIVT